MNSITLKPELQHLQTLNEFILNETGKVNLEVNLIVEEVFVNIVNYSKADFITVNVEFSPPTLAIEFVDNGIEFDPLLKEDPKTPDSIDEAQVGGLGIFFTKQMADEIDYHRAEDENHLKIFKNVES